MSNTMINANVAERLNYQTGMFLTSNYMTLEQNYFINWFRLQNQYLYTPGVLNGMQVTQQNNTLAVSQGVAIDANGNFLILPAGGNNSVPVPADPGNPFYVWAIYSPAVMQDTNVINTAAQLGSGNNLPAGGVLLATVAVDSNNQITGVTDSRAPVTSRLPANLQGKAASVQRALQGVVNVSCANLTTLGSTFSQKVFYLVSQQNAFSTPPSVMVTVQGTLPFAVAVQPDLAYFTLTLTALQSTPAGVTSVDVNWAALALS